MYTHPATLMTEQATIPALPDALRMETEEECRANVPQMAAALDPSDANIDRLYTAAISHGRAILTLIRSIEQHRATKRAPRAA